MTTGERAVVYALAIFAGLALLAGAIATKVQPHYVYRHTRVVRQVRTVLAVEYRTRTRTRTTVFTPSQHCAYDGGARFAFATPQDGDNETPYIAVVCSDGALYTQKVP